MPQMTIVSNRLPISVKKEDGQLKFYPADGGLATGLASYTKSKDNKWVGWPGLISEDLSDKDKRTISTELAKQNCYPVFLSQKQIDGYYNGYSNSVLWPFFHNLPTKFKEHERDWVIYRQVNQLFAEVVMGLSPPENVIWVHDYHLLLVPEMLRRERPYNLTGFFLHTPFPPSNKLKSLPHAKSLLKGLLGSDLIGLHTDTYAQDFLDCCQKLGVGTTSAEQVILKDRIVQVTAFPLGIDYAKFSQADKLSIVQDHVTEMREKYGKRKIILTVDRLDPTKGLLERLEAYRELLRRNRRLRKRVVMVMLAVPTRTEVKAYQRLKTKVERLVDDINHTYGKRNWQPVHYMYKSVPFEELAAFYQIADVAFIAPIKDGMNLVAKEYVASRPDKGALILSETAGAAQELTKALLVNPKQPKSLVKGLKDALKMRPRELSKRLTHMQQHLEKNTMNHWKRAFLGSLQASDPSLQQPTKRLNDAALNKLLKDFKQAAHPALFIDYDGVLVPFADEPKAAIPSAATLKLLKRLAKHNSAEVLIISGRNRQDLYKWLGDLDVSLAAEHGALIRPRGAKRWRRIVDLPTQWKKLIRPVLQKYADKTPGAFMEEKENSLVWHYRRASPFYAQKYILVLVHALRPLLKPMGLALYRGHMILEIKSPEANKGTAVSNCLKPKHDFILAIGDDYTDEDMFAALSPSSYTVKVGPGPTLARYRLNSVKDVQVFLNKLAKS